ncbi:hypothetical protein L0O83_13195 [Lawsonibacter sp. DFI.5.51]|nr:hypothetical protein [Lawsonibacter sp. DFI.5.51]
MQITWDTGGSKPDLQCIHIPQKIKMQTGEFRCKISFFTSQQTDGKLHNSRHKDQEREKVDIESKHTHPLLHFFTTKWAFHENHLYQFNDSR